MAKSATFVRCGLLVGLAGLVLATGCGSSGTTALQVVQAAATHGQRRDVAVLQYLRGSGEVIEIGRNEMVRRADTTHYKAPLDLAMAREREPEKQRQAYDQATAQLGVDTLPAEIWVDEEGRMRTLTFTVDLSKAKLPNGATAAGTLRMTMELYDFGVDVDVSAPPADQVGDLKTLIEDQSGGS